MKELNKYLNSIEVKSLKFEDEITFNEKIKDQICCGFNSLVYGYGSK